MGTDRMTKLLLGAIAVGIWMLVLIEGTTTRVLRELQAEVTAIGVDTERIHEDIDPGGENEEEGAGARDSRHGDGEPGTARQVPFRTTRRN